MKRIGWATIVLIFGWSIITDIQTYNVIFKTDKSLFMYCMDGLMFNIPKCAIPCLLICLDHLLGKVKKHEDRIDRCR